METTASLRVNRPSRAREQVLRGSRKPPAKRRRDIPPHLSAARLALKRAARAQRRACAAAEEARRRSLTAKQLLAELRTHEQHARQIRARVAQSPNCERSLAAVAHADQRVRSLREALRSARIAAIEVRALAYRAGRQTRRAVHEARRACERIGLTEQAFRDIISAWTPVDRVCFRSSTLA